MISSLAVYFIAQYKLLFSKLYFNQKTKMLENKTPQLHFQ